MAFRLRPSGGLGRQLRRIVRREFGRALDVWFHADSDGEVTHDVRQSLKKIRAVLRLFRRPLGPHYRPEDRRLRDISHRLASLRDAEVAAEIVRRLRSRYPRRLQGPTTDSVVDALQARAVHISERSEADLACARVELRLSQTSTLSTLSRLGGFAELQRGMTSGYRRARAALSGLTMSSDAGRFHRWRRRVKAHWYQVRLFDGISRAARARGQCLERLETRLGDSHDLAMLSALIRSHRKRYGDERWRAAVLETIAQVEAPLRAQCLKAGAQVFKGKPRAFRREVDRWWHR